MTSGAASMKGTICRNRLPRGTQVKKIWEPLIWRNYGKPHSLCLGRDMNWASAEHKWEALFGEGIQCRCKWRTPEK